MKMVLTNDPGSNGMLHLEERKYIPEGWDVVIADMKAEGDNAEFYKLLEDADVVINSYVYFGKKEIDALKKCKCISFHPPAITRSTSITPLKRASPWRPSSTTAPRRPPRTR